MGAGDAPFVVLLLHAPLLLLLLLLFTEPFGSADDDGEEVLQQASEDEEADCWQDEDAALLFCRGHDALQLPLSLPLLAAVLFELQSLFIDAFCLDALKSLSILFLVFSYPRLLLCCYTFDLALLCFAVFGPTSSTRLLEVSAVCCNQFGPVCTEFVSGFALSALKCLLWNLLFSFLVILT